MADVQLACSIIRQYMVVIVVDSTLVPVYALSC